MREELRRLYLEMIRFDADPDLIQHFTKVHSYAKMIGEEEGMEPEALFALEAAALTHDIGIPVCNQKYGAHPGPMQEKEGPPLACEMLTRLGFPPETTHRACVLVGEHHTLIPVDGLDHQILLEADFIVNSFENGFSRDALYHTWKTVFATKTGRRIYALMFGLSEDEA